MAKTATATTTKAATRSANEKTKVPKEDKPKRAPSAYNLYVSQHMKPWLADNPGMKNTDAMKAIGVMWKDAPENPNQGKETKARKPKAPKEKVAKEKKTAKGRKEKENVQSSSDVEEELEEGSSEQ
ncbi:hypothetical protein PILCRDRAFT_828363 [Piloderma croceum F 1598]|uniref:HMG box domain-containing protein n=1 Tax=Piloderma croceum (strain F 1598) TaxID=765440 RepID=A0A0C3F2X9_PILCF|nr:hypothetical protein PILCRDRAFT_828363 [Piloderma croceum F 1598]